MYPVNSVNRLARYIWNFEHYLGLKYWSDVRKAELRVAGEKLELWSDE
jgi:hypothetical protein